MKCEIFFCVNIIALLSNVKFLILKLFSDKTQASCDFLYFFYEILYHKCHISKSSLNAYVTKPSKPRSCNEIECKNGEFLCSFFKFCISIELVCDGINHCLRNEDEENCGLFFIFFFN